MEVAHHAASLTRRAASLAILALLPGGALGQQSEVYDTRTGRSVGRSTADSSGTVTNTDSRGKVTSREFTSGNTTTVYDAGGRNVGRVTTSQQR